LAEVTRNGNFSNMADPHCISQNQQFLGTPSSGFYLDLLPLLHFPALESWLFMHGIRSMQGNPDEQCYFFGRQGVRGRQKINCLGLWRSKTIFFGGGRGPSGRQVINSTIELRHSRTPTNEFGCHCLAGGVLRISSSSDVRTVYRHIQHRAAPRPPGCKGGSVVMNKRDKRTGTGLRT
jgi:hypothetical protein